MRIIAKRRLVEFAEKHANCADALFAWHAVAAKAGWKNITEVRQTYPTADPVDDKTVFNIKGNKYRLITTIYYDKGIIYIGELLTHAEYDKGDWKTR